MQIGEGIKNSLLGLLFIALLSCGKSPMFDQFKPVNEGWHMDSIAEFVVPVENSDETYAVSVKLRHNADYPYANLYLFRTISSSEGVEYHDTVNLTLADQSGKWLGNGIGEVKTMEWIYSRRGLKFTHTGNYTFTLQHGMRDTVLDGIMDVGLEINPIDKMKSE